MIGDIAFEVGAEKRENGWSFSGELGGLMRIGVALDAVSRHFGLTLPDALRDMELTRLRLRFATTAAPTPEPAALPTASPAPQHPAQPAASSVAGAPPSAEKAVAGAPKQAAPANAAATVAPNKGATAPAATAEAPAAGGTSTDVAFTCAGTLPVGGGEFDFTVDIEVSEQADGGYDRQVQGTLSFAGMTFSAAFGASDEASSFVAAYVAPPDDPGVGLGELARALAPEDPGLPPELDSVRLSLRDALFAYHRPKLPDGGPAPAKTLVALDAGIDVGLSALPLAGAALPPSEKLRLEFQPLFATDDFAADDLAAVGALAPSGGPALPDALPRGLTLALTLHLGGTPLRLSLPVGSRRKDKLPAAPAAAGTPADTVATTPASTSAGTTAAAPGGTAAGTVAGAAGTPPAAGGATESTVQKSAGPVQVQRVYVRYEGGDVWLYLDAALRAGKLTLALDGLGVGIPLASLGAGPLRPKFALRGVGISYASDDVEIGGFLLHLPPEAAGAADEYAGLAVIRTPRLNLSAIGSYAEVDGQRSLFLYAVLNQPIGGPAFFFVTGLAAAFGYNRALRMPALEEVARFPLVAEAVRGGPPPPASGPGQREFLMERITALRDYVPVQPGEHFFALGVRFTSFRQVDSFALLVVRVREQVEVDVLGLSTAVIPSPDPAGKAVPPLAEVQIALRATFRPAEGFLGVQGQLTPASYLFSRDCRLTGGFAFYSWFSGEHAGDFVLTLGGYHPAYRRPAHYPQVPRLAINWQVTPQLSIKGEAYFALTAGALMAGGRLQATWRSGPLTAWFTVGADFLLAWKPYHYEARAYVNVGVSYTFTLFGTHHVTAEIGADLRLWGPPFSGVAHVTLAIVSFTIQFGAPARRPVPLEWKQFRASFLPAGSGAVCGVSAAGGLVRAVPGTAAAGEVWIVNPKDLVLVTNSVIPATRAEVGGNAVTQLSFADDAHSRPTPLTTDLLFDVDGSTFPGVTAFLREHGVAFKANDSHARMRVLARRFLEVALPRPAPIPPIGIAPMQVRRGAAAATHAVRVTREDGTDATGWFTFTPVLKKAPAALWGDAFKPQLNGPSWIDGTLAGFEIRPRSPARESATHAVPRENLQYETVLAPTAVGVPAARRFVPGSAQGETHLRDRLAAEATAAARGALLSALGFDPAAAVTELDASIAGDFVVTPRSGTFAAA
ncbi:MAG TPA: DUF6603 domain-containing protein [Longimicrobium sp.]|nr:DUF6603 domain-containing protein [Longimicrobium sp.]